MTYFTSWDEFAKNVERLQAQSPKTCRFVTKYNHRDGLLVIKMTDDVVCLQYRTTQLQDLKRLEKLSATVLRNTLIGCAMITGFLLLTKS